MEKNIGLEDLTMEPGFTKIQPPVSTNLQAPEDGTDQSQNGTGGGGTPPGK